MKFKTLDDIDVNGLRVLIRADLDVPIKSGIAEETIRLNRFIPTLKRLVAANAKTIIIGHLGRPKSRDMAFSLHPVATALSKAIGQPIKFVSDCIGESVQQAVASLQPGEILMLENLRFYPAEMANDNLFARYRAEDDNTGEFARTLASYADIYVNDAFATSQRPHASVVELPRLLPAYAGPIMQAEVTALESALEHPQPPVMAIAGGSKVSTKLDLLNNIIPRVQKLVLGGAMANTFLYAQGMNVGASMCEKDMVETVREILATAEKHGCEIILPTDAQLADGVKSDANIRTAPITDIQGNEMILDFGPESLARVEKILGECKTLLWNGPLGVFEVPPFNKGTVEVARFAAAQTKSGQLLSIAGGGDTAAAMNHAGVMDEFTYISTAGGAFLEWLEGKTLPGVAALAS